MIAKKCISTALAPFPFLLTSIILSFFYQFFIFLTILILSIQIFFIYFFRDMSRNIEEGIISPADGRVFYAEKNKISIFMSLFDMHVNLMPYDGKVVSIRHYDGIHEPAYGNVSKNERQEIEIESDIGNIKIIQIAGIFARRILCYVREGDFLKKGEKIGVIKFGSRVEMHLPENCIFFVEKGEKIKAGETVAKFEVR
ncbi:MAG TPA: phosphatidylserine decarboxylase [Thermoplasmatales archaeon]|nr:phosphatidylserine decarboxylase [Thermoplasmatales archaeon]